MEEIGVVGLDEPRKRWLERIGEVQGFTSRAVLPFEKVRYAASFDIEALLDEAREQMRRYPVDGITTYWDFPSTPIAAILAEEFGLPTPGLRPTVNLEHKYWSRLAQQRVAPEDTPEFAVVDLFEEGGNDAPPLDYPFWFKPVKSYSGHLGFHIRSEHDYREALDKMRAGIRRIGDPFQTILDRVADLPDDIARIGANAAIAEQIIDGQQCTLEGHVHEGDVEVHGIFDIFRGEDGSTFTHYVYPSLFAAGPRERMGRIARDLVEEVGYGHGPFNIEFFVDEDRTHILEVNPRISQEHSHLMDWVDDSTNLEVMAQAALGQRPKLEPREGPSSIAGKFFVREWEDAIVASVPGRERLSDIEDRYAPCVIQVMVKEGDQLSEMPDQEPYSFIVAEVHLGAGDLEELCTQYQEIIEELPLEFRPPS